MEYECASDDFEKVGHVVIGEQNWTVDAPVILWTESGLETKIGDGARRRYPKKNIVDLFVWHWTGGENDVPTLFNVLDRRELGVEFAIDHNGVIWQFCDPWLVDTFDAGYVNPRSFGCEIVCYGFSGKNRKLPPLGKLRDTYLTKLRGRQRRFARFFPAQLNSAFALAEVCSKAVPTITKRIPCDEDGSILMRTMSQREVRNYSGHIGHFHISENKSDPGADLLEMFRANGY